jgi:hypothetical protein
VRMGVAAKPYSAFGTAAHSSCGNGKAVSSADWGEPAGCASDVRWRRISSLRAEACGSSTQRLAVQLWTRANAPAAAASAVRRARVPYYRYLSWNLSTCPAIPLMPIAQPRLSDEQQVGFASLLAKAQVSQPPDVRDAHWQVPEVEIYKAAPPHLKGGPEFAGNRRGVTRQSVIDMGFRPIPGQKFIESAHGVAVRHALKDAFEIGERFDVIEPCGCYERADGSPPSVATVGARNSCARARWAESQARPHCCRDRYGHHPGNGNGLTSGRGRNGSPRRGHRVLGCDQAPSRAMASSPRRAAD